VWGGYGLGDLDEPHFARTRWFVSGEALALRYDLGDHVTAITFGASAGIGELFEALPLPETFHLHLPAAHREALHPRVQGTLGSYVRFGLHAGELREVATPERVEARLLTPADVDAALELYAHYPGNWFDPIRLAEGCYLGLFEGGRLTATGGTHVGSGRDAVAAVGDIVTAPDARGRGLATYLSAELCRRLFERVELVVLNVAEHNAAARRAYAKVGFAHPVPHDEGFDLRRRVSSDRST
jgi:RimJ/RimL family protein N-acetyltransferase